MRLRLGTRGSALAVGQSTLIADLLRAQGHDVELVRIRTAGDVERGSLSQLEGVGVFAAELRRALLDGECDFAVHSLKDLPTTPVPGLVIAAVPERADARDALCARDGLTLADLPAGATVGTGSPRRVAQLRITRPDLRYVDVRGNVGTRLARVADGDLDAVVLAAAGLARLGLLDRVTDHLEILPAPGQGALALEARAGDDAVLSVLRVLEDPDTRLAVDAERAVLARLGGGCAAPIAAWGRSDHLVAGVFATDGSVALRMSGRLADGGDALARRLLEEGAANVTDLAAARPSRLADLHDDTSLWRGPAVLAGLRVLVPREDGDLADGIRAAGAEVVAQPVQRRVTLDPQRNLLDADWVALTSPATVRILADLGLRVPDGAQVAAVGEITANAARAAGMVVALVPAGESSAASLAAAWPEGAGRVSIPGSALIDGAGRGPAGQGYDVDQFAIYTMEPLDSVPDDVVEDYQSGRFDAVLVTSGSMGRAINQLLGWHAGTSVVAFGPPSARALSALGVAVGAVAATQDVEGVVAALAALGKERL